MINYVLRRFVFMIVTVVIISVVSFAIITLPPGDYVTTLQAAMLAAGDDASLERLEMLRARYGLDEPAVVQYLTWVKNIVAYGDFGYSFEWNRPVSELIWRRLGLTLVVSGASLLFTWVISFPAGIYAAVKQHSIGDYTVTFVGFLGLATPNFLLALILMWIGYTMGANVGGLFSYQYADAPWSVGKLIDLLKHIWIPMVVVGTAGTASLIRVMRNNLLDELRKPYVETARAKGMKEWRLVLKYPVRIALIPFVSTVGWTLPALISGAAVTSVVLNLPTSGSMLLRALQSQDMYLAGSFILLLSTLTVVGTLVSDILLAWLDPRIQYT